MNLCFTLLLGVGHLSSRFSSTDERDLNHESFLTFEAYEYEEGSKEVGAHARIQCGFA